MADPTRSRFLELIGGLLLGAICAVALKGVLWLVPLMMYVGD